MNQKGELDLGGLTRCSYPDTISGQRGASETTKEELPSLTKWPNPSKSKDPQAGKQYRQLLYFSNQICYASHDRKKKKEKKRKKKTIGMKKH